MRRIALDLWAETFAQAASASKRFRGSTPEETVGWLYGIARRPLAGHYRCGTAERRALDRLKLERPPADPELLAEVALVASGRIKSAQRVTPVCISPLRSESSHATSTCSCCSSS